jgi:hypothetical protein
MFVYYAEMTVAGDFIQVQFSCVRGEQGYTVQFHRGGLRALTKQGAAFAVLGAVEKAVIEFVDTRRPKWIVLSADVNEPSRVKLYRMLVPRVMKKFPEYTLSEKTTRSFITFNLKKDGGPEPKQREYYGDPVTEVPKEKPSNSSRLNSVLDDDLLAELLGECFKNWSK